MHQSVATLDNPEFINLQPLDINPLMSKCEIKVLYTGKNRNKSLISKEVATEMAKTLRGAPIVGYYKKDTEDFADHGHRIIIDDEGVKFECMTVPYGFVSPDAKVWFQKFEDYDDFGNVTVREYLMTTGYLWTGQFEECQGAVEHGNPQSMELDDKTLNGHWSHDVKDNMDFFIVNDAIFSKLCILGDATEPCFEGSSVTAPNVSASFSLNEDFTKTLYNMMQQLQFALQGGQSMAKELETPVVGETSADFTEAVKEDAADATAEFAKKCKDEKEKYASDEKDNSVGETDSSDSKDNADAKSEDKDDKKKKDFVKEEDEDSKEPESAKAEDDEDEKKKKDFSADEATNYELKYNKLSVEFSNLQKEYQKLLEFKQGIETEKKTQLIDSFYMLSEEDKKDVTEHITEYSLDDIEAKLSVICVRKKVSFDLDDSKVETKAEEEAPVTYSLDDDSTSAVPAWIAAAKRVRDSK